MRQWLLLSALLLLASACSAGLGAPMDESRARLAALAAQQPPPAGTREVVLAVQRDHALHLLDAATLDPLGRFAIHNLGHRVSARADGRLLFLAQASTPDGNGCCALFTLDLAAREMCRLLEPVADSAPSPDGRWLFAQRGNMGVGVYDAQTLAPAGTIAAPGMYALYPSPDDHWLLGITNWQGPSLDVMDVESQILVRRLPIPMSDAAVGNAFGAGAWLGERFYLYGHDGRQASLRAVSAETTALGTGQPIASAVADLAASGLPSAPTLVAGGERLFLYVPLAPWLMFDPRREGSGIVRAGLFVLDPATSQVTAHLAPSVDFAQVVASRDGRRLYGLAAGPPVRLLALDAESGALLAERRLADDVWSVALATLPEELLPYGDVQPSGCARPEPTPFPTPPLPPTAPAARPS